MSMLAAPSILVYARRSASLCSFFFKELAWALPSPVVSLCSLAKPAPYIDDDDDDDTSATSAATVHKSRASAHASRTKPRCMFT